MHLDSFGKTTILLIIIIKTIYTFFACSRLQECHEKLEFDISDKDTALTIDTDCVRLENSSSSIAIQQDPTRIKKGYAYMYIIVILARMYHMQCCEIHSILYNQEYVQ